MGGTHPGSISNPLVFIDIGDNVDFKYGGEFPWIYLYFRFWFVVFIVLFIALLGCLNLFLISLCH